ncbi:tRNA lysidine(34) synthetase TilS [Sphingomonas endolithica]|uniref:tRNA lysidine(34) synthetase TilS n=1 Tax=Sphingomonas endolithica TaxID=2972485 RepID=UPI0021AED84C|nr:tRNA lysidine(34) synthetase TilS [Sphingomonas sp. ZFBP2030]
MALLTLAAAAWPGQVIAATVDHGLRPEAADEAAMVAAFCSALPRSPAAAEVPSERVADEAEAGVPHATLKPATPLGTANLQAVAREARYTLLTKWARRHGATILATAHHADDQAETFLMRAARGSGLSGLAAIRPRRPLDHGITLLRPLLGWRGIELRQLATEWRLPFVDDPSNSSDRHDRTRFRALLDQTPWLDPAQLARSAGYLLEADGDLRAIEAWLLQERSVAAKTGELAIDVSGLPRDLCRRLAKSGIAMVRDAGLCIDSPGHPAGNIEPLLDALAVGKSATQAGVMVSATGNIWLFRPAPPRRPT